MNPAVSMEIEEPYNSSKTYAEATSRTKAEPMVNIPKYFLLILLTDTIKQITEPKYIKQTLILALFTLIFPHNHNE